MSGSNLFPVEDSVFESILNLYNVTEKMLMEDVAKVQEWMKTQPHLPEILDSSRIRNFLLLNKCSVEIAKKKIDMYYTIRSVIPEMFENVNPKLANMKQVADLMYCVPLSKMTSEMYRVIIFKTRNHTLIGNLEPRDVAAYILNLFEIRMNEDYYLGDVVISDMEGLTWNNFMKLSPVLFYKAISIYEKVYSIRVKKFYVINSHPFLFKLLAMLKGIIKPKLFQRLQIVENPKDLVKYIPVEILPKEYGGLGHSCEEIHELIQKKFENYEDRFDQLDRMRVNESLRPREHNDEVLGYYGNFKQLNID